MIPHIMDKALMNFTAFDLEYLAIEQENDNCIIIKPNYSKKHIEDYKSFININIKRFQIKTALFYNSNNRNYLFRVDGNNYNL